MAKMTWMKKIKKFKKSTPFGINFVQRQVLHQAAQG